MITAGSVLFVDDEYHILSFARQVFAHEPYDINIARDSDEALQILQRKKIDVVVCDQGLLGMSGVDLLSKIKEYYPTTVRILMSDHIDAQDILPYVSTGAAYKFFSKPWDEQNLRTMVRDAVCLSNYKSDPDVQWHAYARAVEAVLLLANDGTVLAANDTFYKMAGYVAEELIGKPLTLIDASINYPSIMEAMNASLQAHGQWLGKINLRRQSDEQFTAWLSAAELFDEQHQKKARLYVFQDLTGKSLGDIFAVQRRTDLVTGIASRDAFYKTLQREIEVAHDYKAQFALFAVDIQRFNEIKHILGSSVCDRLLNQIVKRLQTAIRPQDTLARVAKDVFAIFAPDIAEKTQLTDYLQSLQDQFEQSFVVNDRFLRVHASIAGVVYPNHGTTVDALRSRLQLTLNQAKFAHGSNSLIFSGQLSASASQDIYVTEHDIYNAFANQEFQMEYQPQIDVTTGITMGVEAFIRWHHPKWGVLTPYHFLSMIERYQLAATLNEWVVNRVMGDLKTLQDRGFRQLKAMINLTASQIDHDHFLASIQRMFAESGLEPGYIDFEFSDYLFLLPPTSLTHIHDYLDKIGSLIGLELCSIYDHSFDFLDVEQLNYIKLAPQLLNAVVADEHAAKKAREFIQQAHINDKNVYLVGVESGEQMKFAEQMSCLVMQGSYCCQPLYFQELTTWLQQHYQGDLI